MLHCLVLSASWLSGNFVLCPDLMNHSPVFAFKSCLLSNLVPISAKSHQKHSTQWWFHVAGYFVRSLSSFVIHLKRTLFTLVIANFFIGTPGSISSNALWIKFYLQIKVIASNNGVKGHSGIRSLFFSITYHLKLLSHGLHPYIPVFNWLLYHPFYYSAHCWGQHRWPATYFLFSNIVS